MRGKLAGLVLGCGSVLLVAAMVAGCGKSDQGKKKGKPAPTKADRHEGHGHEGHGHEGDKPDEHAATKPTDGAEAPVPQTTCPVMAGKIDKSIYLDHKGSRVYFCCKACLEPFKKDPGKFIKKLEDAGVTLAKTPK